MRSRFFKTYIVYTVLLFLVGTAVLVVCNNMLNGYEAEKEKETAETIKNAKATTTPVPTPEEIVVVRYRNIIDIPKSFVVLDETVKVSEADGDYKRLSVEVESADSDFEVKIADEYGSEGIVGRYHFPEVKTYYMSIPSNFRVEFGRSTVKAADYITSMEDYQEYKRCYAFADMPKKANYVFGNALKEPEIVIYDNLNNEIKPVWENELFVVTGQTSKDEPDADGPSREEIMVSVMQWSALMHNELGTIHEFRDSENNTIAYTEGMSTAGLKYRPRYSADHGFSLIEPYLLADTELYKDLKGWVQRADIKTVSDHAPNPEIQNEKVENYVRYGENMFSVDVSFTKVLKLWNDGKHKFNITAKDDTTSSIYFVKNSDKESDIKWLIAEIVTL